MMIDRYVAERLPIRYWWMDAGWYVNDGGWVNIGTWEVDRKRFPNGLRAITDHGRAKGVKSIVWFEPERVTTDSWLFKNHPEWCLDGKNCRRRSPTRASGGCSISATPRPGNGWSITSTRSSPRRASTSTGRISTWTRSPSGRPRTRRTGRASPKSATSPATSRIGTNCAAGIPACSSIAVPAAAAATTWKPCAARVPLLRDDYLFDPVAQQAPHATAFRSGCRITAPARASFRPWSAPRKHPRSRSKGGCRTSSAATWRQA